MLIANKYHAHAVLTVVLTDFANAKSKLLILCDAQVLVCEKDLGPVEVDIKMHVNKN